MTDPHRLRARVRAILLNEWDPIHIGEVRQAQDEYNSYVAPVATMLVAGAQVSQITQYLLDIEVHAMGLIGDRDRARSAAEQLVRLNAS